MIKTFCFLALAIVLIASSALAQSDRRRFGGYGPGFHPAPGGGQLGPGGGGFGPGGGGNGPGGGYGQGCWNCGYMGALGGYESGNPIPTMPPPPPRYQSESVNGDWYY